MLVIEYIDLLKMKKKTTHFAEMKKKRIENHNILKTTVKITT